MLSDAVGQCAVCVLNYHASSATGTGTIKSVLRERLLTWLSPPPHRGIKLEDLAKYIVAAPSMQGNQPMSGETLNVHLRQSFELAGEPVQ